MAFHRQAFDSNTCPGDRLLITSCPCRSCIPQASYQGMASPSAEDSRFVSGYGLSHTVSGANREPGFSPCAPSSLFRIRVWLHPPLCPFSAVSYQGMASAVPSQGKQRDGLQPLCLVIAVSYQDMASLSAEDSGFVSGHRFSDAARSEEHRRASAAVPRHRRFVSGYGFSRTVPSRTAIGASLCA